MKLFPALFIAASLSVASCGSTAEPSSAPAEDSTIPGSAASSRRTLTEQQSKALFVVDTYEDSMAVPRSKIFVDYNDKRIFLAEIAGIASIESGNGLDPDGIPKEAIATCGCWYAGGSDYYYIVPTATGIAVYHGWQDEGVEGPGYHWKEWKKID